MFWSRGECLGQFGAKQEIEFDLCVCVVSFFRRNRCAPCVVMRSNLIATNFEIDVTRGRMRRGRKKCKKEVRK